MQLKPSRLGEVLMPSLKQGMVVDENSTVAELMIPSQMSWNQGVIKGLFTEEAAEAILQLQISNDINDKLIWATTNFGIFNSKSADKAIAGPQCALALSPQSNHMASNQQVNKLWPTLWNINMHRRYKVIFLENW